MNVRRGISVAVAITAVASVAALGAQSLSSGVGVSGHWVIQVLNADGSVASRTEFDNHLTADGAALLARIALRQGTAGSWQIASSGARVGAPGVVSISMGESSNPALALSSPAPGSLRLSGEARPNAAVDLRDVSTSLKECAASVTAIVCARDSQPGTVRAFTAFTLPSPIRAAANQTVQVQVDIGFSPMP